MLISETANGSPRYRELFFKIKIGTLSFKKIDKKFSYVHNVEIYNYATFQLKILRILGCTKKIGNFFDILYFSPPRFTHLSFYPAHNTTYFVLKSCTRIDNIIIYIWDFFSRFLETLKCHFWFFFQRKLHVGSYLSTVSLIWLFYLFGEEGQWKVEEKKWLSCKS